jgi:hypothetical protein
MRNAEPIVDCLCGAVLETARDGRSITSFVKPQWLDALANFFNHSAAVYIVCAAPLVDACTQMEGNMISMGDVLPVLHRALDDSLASAQIMSELGWEVPMESIKSVREACIDRFYDGPYAPNCALASLLTLPGRAMWRNREGISEMPPGPM